MRYPTITNGERFEMDKEYLLFENMYKGLKLSCKNVRWKSSVSQFELNALKNTAKAIRSISNGTYKLSDYQKFTIYEPKLRHITATRIKDRQIQRSLCDTVLYKEITKSFIHSNGACQRGKGIDFVLKDFKNQLHKFYRKHSNDGYYLKCDIHHFFESIDHDVLKAKLRKRIEDKHILDMVNMVIDSFGDKGLGLGSQISQLMALFYLDELDHIIKEKLHIKFYTRYMDDFILVSHDKAELLNARKVIKEYLLSIGLSLNNKTTLQKVKFGIMYLHWKYVITDSGKILMLPDKKRLTKRKRKIKKLVKMFDEGKISYKNFMQSINGVKAYLSKGNSCKALQEINKIIEKRLNSTTD